MSNPVIHHQTKAFERPLPEICPGYTVRVHERIKEGEKERVQIFEGLVISVHKGHVPTDRSFTVRRILSGIGVEKVFPFHAPTIEKIEVKKVAEIRRAKLNFLRGRTGKAARLSERFTNADEFSVVMPEGRKEEVAPAAEEVQPVAAEETKTEEAAA